MFFIFRIFIPCQKKVLFLSENILHRNKTNLISERYITSSGLSKTFDVYISSDKNITVL